MEQQGPEVVVIGGGLAGLSAAVTAAGRGAKVTVFEARSALGGRARTTITEGFSLNEGAHALYVGGATHGFLSGLGVDPAGGSPNLAAAVGVDGSEIDRMPIGPMSLMRTGLLAGSRIRFGRLFARLERMDTSRYDSVTVTDALADLLGQGRGARVASALIRLATYGNDPDRLSAGAAFSQLALSAGSGVRYVDGGWGRIVESLSSVAEERGVRIVKNAKISDVRDISTGVELTANGRHLNAAAAVIAVGGPEACRSLLAAPHSTTANWSGSVASSTVACLDVGLDEPWGSAPTFALGISEPVYLSVHAPVAKLAEKGRSLVHVMRYIGSEESNDSAEPRSECESLLDRMRPGWRRAAIHVGFSRRLVSSYGQPLAAAGGIVGRPSVVVPGGERITVAGDWVGAVGLLSDASVSSGIEAGVLVGDLAAAR